VRAPSGNDRSAAKPPGRRGAATGTAPRRKAPIMVRLLTEPAMGAAAGRNPCSVAWVKPATVRVRPSTTRGENPSGDYRLRSPEHLAPRGLGQGDEDDVAAPERGLRVSQTGTAWSGLPFRRDSIHRRVLRADWHVGRHGGRADHDLGIGPAEHRPPLAMSSAERSPPGSAGRPRL